MPRTLKRRELMGAKMAEFNASLEALAQAGQGVRDSADGLQGRVQTLTARVEALLDGGWQGQASNAFRRDWQTWLDGARGVIGGLDTTSQLLISGGQSYGEQESVNTTGVRRSGSSLNL